MRIGIDIRLIGKKQTGSEVVFFNVVKNLARIDTHNEYALFTDITDPATLEIIATDLGIQNSENFKIISLETANKFTWNFWTLPKFLRANPADIYVTQYITPLFVPNKIKIVTFIHDVSFQAYPQFIKFWDLFFLKTLIPISIRRADKVIGVSRFTRNEILKYYKINPEKVEWIHNAVGDNFQREISEEEIGIVRKKYALPEKFILYIGTLQPRKNLPALIEAYAHLPEEIKADIKLVLAGGKGHNFDMKIEETVKKFSLEDSVYFPGFVDEEDKPAIFIQSAIFCNPSFYEGFGITVLEAMSLGIPVVASDIPPHREIAEDSILFFNPEIASALTEKINHVLMNGSVAEEIRRKELAQAKKFSWMKTAEKVLEIFKKSVQ